MNNTITTFIIITSLFLSSHQLFAQQDEEKCLNLVRITEIDQQDLNTMDALGIQYAMHDVRFEAQAFMTDAEVQQLSKRGILFEILDPCRSPKVDDQYHSYIELMVFLDSIANAHPDICQLETIGYSQLEGLPIPMLKISDNPGMEEDETAVMYDGMHHAREPLGMEIILNTADYLLSNYGSDPDVTFWIDNTEIFMVPCLNPEGWKYIVDANLNYPYWRKNKRDNNGNGTFDHATDGVDLNRNYDYYWINGDDDFNSWTYCGSAPFSETETQAIFDLAYEQKPIFSISYHTYGEIIYWPANLNGQSGPEIGLLYSIVTELAGLIPKLGSGTYDEGGSNCNVGMSYCWMYPVPGIFQYLIECGLEFIPDAEVFQQVVDDHLQGALYPLQRINGPGLAGHITDAFSGAPLEATVRIIENENALIEARSSEGLYGRYHRMLFQGAYTVEVSKEGYYTEILENVLIGADTVTMLDIALNTIVNIEEISPVTEVGVVPNPVLNEAVLNFHCVREAKISVALYNLLGQQITILADRVFETGQQQLMFNTDQIEPGLYFYAIRAGQSTLTGKIVVQ